MDEVYACKTVNSTAPLLTAVLLCEHDDNSKYLKVCKEVADFIIRKFPLTREGGWEHTVTKSGTRFDEQIWADTLFMVCIFLSKLGQLTSNAAYMAFTINQLKIHH